MIWKADFLSMLEIRLREILTAGVKDSLFCQALTYQFFPSGKRLRPLLSAALFNDFKDLGLGAESSSEDAMLDFCCALEILHTASLVHDDLPALDNDSERRGRATLHVKVGEGRALLAGDYLISRAFSVCSDISSNLPGPKSSNLCRLLADNFCEVCFGQDLDIRNSSKELNDALELYDLKTGSLFHAALEGVRLLCLADNNCYMQIKRFAVAFGRAFQLQNDIKDLEASQQQPPSKEIASYETAATGLQPQIYERTSNSDAKNQRATALTLSSSSVEEISFSAFNETWTLFGELESALAESYKVRDFKLHNLASLVETIIPAKQSMLK